MKDYNRFLKEIRTFIPKDRIYVDELRRLAWGTDAGFYRLIPKIVIRSMDEGEVSRIMKAASSEGISVTFRAAGTSLSGQAISDSVLVVAGKNWERYSYDPATTDITLEPGLVGAEVNRILAKYGRHFGPDPASIG
ncbi:MAG: FAD-binding oxidoreductase, partial [Bacteroidales bacterium]|nr:FAD-binding oxidoreductase [Bacteroidales bacterium]